LTRFLRRASIDAANLCGSGDTMRSAQFRASVRSSSVAFWLLASTDGGTRRGGLSTCTLPRGGWESRIDVALTQDDRLYFRGDLGGGTWAVERDSELDDLATCYELQAAVGLTPAPFLEHGSSVEVAYLFGRKLEYASGLGDYHPNSTVMVRTVARY